MPAINSPSRALQPSACLARTSPLHKWLADEIRGQITRRELAPGEGVPPELELCKAYDVSRGTVRQALATLAQEGLIERHPGRGSFVRKSLPGRDSSAVAAWPAQLELTTQTFHVRVLVDSVGPASKNFVLLQTIEGLNLAAQRLGRACKLTYEFHSFTQADEPTGRAFLHEEGCDGLIVVPYSHHCMAFLEGLKQPPKPLATLYRHIQNDRIYRFAIDNNEGAYLATDYLLRLGHRRIALLLTSHEAAMPSTIERHEGYQRAMQEAGCADDNLVAMASDIDPRSIRANCHRLLKQDDAPTALLVGGMSLMVPTLDAISDINLSVPGDLSLIGFDESEAARSHHPPISIVRMPLVDNGQRALEQLMDAMTTKTPPAAKESLMVPDIVIRQSCRPLVPLGRVAQA